MMYHYTHRSEDNLLSAANNSHTEELKEYFSHMAKEERGHYILAREDLKEFGDNVSNETPEVVIKINKFWDTLSSKHVNGYLGLVYVFENVVPHMGDKIIKFVEKLELTKKQARFLIVHGEADLDHGDEAKEFALKYIGEAPDVMIEAAEQACELLINLMREAFKPV